jgi:hypothetical protein
VSDEQQSHLVSKLSPVKMSMSETAKSPKVCLSLVDTIVLFSSKRDLISIRFPLLKTGGEADAGSSLIDQMTQAARGFQLVPNKHQYVCSVRDIIHTHLLRTQSYLEMEIPRT